MVRPNAAAKLEIRNSKFEGREARDTSGLPNRLGKISGTHGPVPALLFAILVSNFEFRISNFPEGGSL
jgi:hypothetical protein